MSIRERATKLKTFIFEHNADFQRDDKTIAELKKLDQTSVVELLEQAVSKDTRRMVNCLLFAENHDNPTGVKSSFDDINIWKASRSYK